MDAAHLHLALNHVPVVGVPLVMLLLGWGLLRRNREIVRLAFGALALMALATAFVYLTGEPTEELVEGLAGVSEPLLERHEEAAQLTIILVGILGIAGLFGLVFTRQRSPFRYGLLVLVLSVLPVAALARTANLGGQVRHPEIRPGASLTAESPDGTETQRLEPGDR